MKKHRIKVTWGWLRLACIGFLFWTFGLSESAAFSLIGPYASWMDVTKGYQTGAIGGPMNIGEGYRWNMPVITYGFDRSFRDYFGSNGVAAVENAMQILNQLPAASLVNISNYSSNAWRVNYAAQATSLIDVKSTVMSLLIENMGLAPPVSYVFCIRDYQLISGNNYNFFVIDRNFDPVTAKPSFSINGTLYTYEIFQSSKPPTPTNMFCVTIASPIDPMALTYSTAADFSLNPSWGVFMTGLSKDDVGGLRYLLNGNQILYESLLPDVRAVDTNTMLVVSAYRPGIEKVNFVPHPVSQLSGQFKSFTNQWMDVFYTADDYPDYQEVQRITKAPDILFTARDLGPMLLYSTTSTTNWSNNANLNGNAGGAGPGVIQPPVVITLNSAIPVYVNSSPINLNQLNAAPYYGYWGSFDGSTNAPIIYPSGQVLFQPSKVLFNLMFGNSTKQFIWTLSGGANGLFYFQTATNMNSWTTLATLTNSGAAINCLFQAITNEQGRYFRISPAH